MVSALLLAAAASGAFDCRAALEQVAAQMRGQGYEAVAGPYVLASGELRAHGVFTEGGGHRIVEHRCEGGRVVSRSWTESEGADAGQELTMDSLERIARRLNQSRRQQQQ